MSTIPTTTVTELPDDAVIVDVREADEWAPGTPQRRPHPAQRPPGPTRRAARHRRHDPDRLPQRRTLRPRRGGCPAGLRRRQRRGRDARVALGRQQLAAPESPASSDTHPGPCARPAPSRDDDPPEMTDNRDRFDGTEPDPDADRWSAWLPPLDPTSDHTGAANAGRRRRRHRCRRARTRLPQSWPAAEPLSAVPQAPMPAQRAYSSYRRRHCCRSPSSGPSPRDATSAWRSSPPSSASPRWASSPSSSPSRSPSCTSRAGWPRPSAHHDAPATGPSPRSSSRPLDPLLLVRPGVLRPCSPSVRARSARSGHFRRGQRHRVGADELVALRGAHRRLEHALSDRRRVHPARVACPPAHRTPTRSIPTARGRVAAAKSSPGTSSSAGDTAYARPCSGPSAGMTRTGGRRCDEGDSGRRGERLLADADGIARHGPVRARG